MIKLAKRITSSRLKRGGIIALGMSGMLFAASMLAPASGAYFFSSKDGHATITTPSLDLSLANGDGSSPNGSFDLGFNDLVPGSMNQQTFTVTNTGSIPGNLYLYSSAQASGPNNFDLNQLHYGVDNFGSIPLTPTFTDPVSLGTLQANESRTYSITAQLDALAGNEWQGVTVSNTLEVALQQLQ